MEQINQKRGTGVKTPSPRSFWCGIECRGRETISKWSHEIDLVYKLRDTLKCMCTYIYPRTCRSDAPRMRENPFGVNMCMYHPRMYVCIYICMYVYIYKCIHIFMFICIHICTRTRYMCMYHPRIYIIYVHINMHICAYTCVHFCVYICVRIIRVCEFEFLNLVDFGDVAFSVETVLLENMHTSVCVREYVYVCVCKSMYTCVRDRVCICVCEREYEYAYKSVHT